MSNLQSTQAMQLPTLGTGHVPVPSFSRIIGIDPGASGAIALLVSGVLISVHDMPTVTVERNKSQKRQVCPAGLSLLIESLTGPYVTKAICEKVGARPGQGVSSMFSFGRSVGIIEGVLAARQIPVTFVTPQAWQKQSGAAKGKDGSRQRVMELFPQEAHLFARVKDDGRADAVLIALMGQV
jgi:crossover junction endodeoxyribonuclease RuvC